MTKQKVHRLKYYTNLLLSAVLILGIIYMVFVTIGIYENALNYRTEPFYTSYLLFSNFDRTLTSLRLSLYLFYVFFALTLFAPVVVLLKELKGDSKESIEKEET